MSPTSGGRLERPDGSSLAEHFRRDAANASRAEYAAFRSQIVQAILRHSLTPLHVARALERAADRFPEISLEECRFYRACGDTWQPWRQSPITFPLTAGPAGE